MDKIQEFKEKIEALSKEYGFGLEITHTINIVPLKGADPVADTKTESSVQ